MQNIIWYSIYQVLTCIADYVTQLKACWFSCKECISDALKDFKKEKQITYQMEVWDWDPNSWLKLHVQHWEN